MSTSTQTNTKKLNIVAIGGAAKILASFPKNQNLFALDTNSKNLNSLPDFVQKIQFGNGDGSGGDPKVAEQLFDQSLVEPIFDCDLLVLIAGLGGGTGSGITPLLAQIAKEKGILTKLICFSPLDFEGSKTSSAEILTKFQELDLPITLIDNQQILEKMPKTTGFDEFWKVANFGAKETINAVKSILESSNIDFLDIRKTFNYQGFCYSNIAKGSDFEIAFKNLESTTTLDQNSFKTAKGFLLNFKIGKSGMTLAELTKIQEFIKFVQNSIQADLKTNQEMVESEEFEITVFVSGIGTQTKIDENYSKIIQEKAENERAKYISETNSQNARQKFKN